MSRLTHLIRKSPVQPDLLLLMRVVKCAVDEARHQHPRPYVDLHHMLGVLEEEIHELKLECYKKRPNMERVQSELLQVAAVAVRGIEDVTLNPEAR